MITNHHSQIIFTRLLMLWFAGVLFLAPATSIAQSPTAVGGVDSISDTGLIVGWVYDSSTPTASVKVRIYKNGLIGFGGEFVMEAIANIYRPDINKFYKIKGSHGFSLQLPANVLTQPTQLFVYGTDVSSEFESLLTQGIPVSDRWAAFPEHNQAVFLDVTNGVLPNEDAWGMELLAPLGSYSLFALNSRYVPTANPVIPGSVLRKSDLGDQTWSSVYYFPHAVPHIPLGQNLAMGLTAPQEVTNVLLVAGYYDNLSNGDTHWLIQRSPDAGITWQTVLDSPPAASGRFGRSRKIYFAESDSFGRLYVVGRTENGWAILKSQDQGLTWTPLDIPYETYEFGSKAFGVTAVSQDIILTSGLRALNSDTNLVWTIRRSLDAGETWTEVSNFQLANNREVDFVKLFTSRTGRVFAHGSAQDANGQWHAIVRIGYNNYTSWITLLDYSAPNQYVTPIDMTEDRFGNLYLSVLSGPYAIILKSSDAIHWSIFDRYVGPKGKGATPRSLILDQSGQLISNGTQVGSSGLRQAYVKRFSFPSP